jgi:hypothetical protein
MMHHMADSSTGGMNSALQFSVSFQDDCVVPRPSMVPFFFGQKMQSLSQNQRSTAGIRVLDCIQILRKGPGTREKEPAFIKSKRRKPAIPGGIKGRRSHATTGLPVVAIEYPDQALSRFQSRTSKSS